jgi:hypothetical protein
MCGTGLHPWSTWSDNSRAETDFELYRREGAGGWRLLALLTANQASYFDFGLAPGIAYSYRSAR